MSNSEHIFVETLGGGTQADGIGKGPYLQNVLLVNSVWEVRPGFGQVSQHESTLSRRSSRGDNQGITKHLGSATIQTNQGHTQILSVFSARVFTSDTTLSTGSWSHVVSVHIQDLTSSAHHEEVLYRHTGSNNTEVAPAAYWEGHYESSLSNNSTSWLRATDPVQVAFSTWGKYLVFGSKDIGLWVYTPADFLGGRPRGQASDGANEGSWHPPYSEGAVVAPVSPTDGIYNRAITYLSSSEYPTAPAAIATVGGRLAIAQGRDVYFSDLESPAAIIAENVITIQSRDTITALQEVGDALLIFTKSETFHYMLPKSQVVSGGRLSNISNTIGCLSASSVTLADEVAVWVDHNGVHASAGGLQLLTLSEDIEPFFLDHITSPLTSYYTHSGITGLTATQPRMVYQLAPELVSVAYDSKRKYVYVSVPDIDIVLCLHLPTKFWSIALLESNVIPLRDVGTQRNLSNPWITATPSGDGVYLVGAPEYKFYNDDIHQWIPSIGSYFITELGRGGALDRSVDGLEDNRIGIGQYSRVNASASGPSVYLGKPALLPDNYRFPGGIGGCPSYPNGALKSDVVLVPFEIADNTGDVNGLAFVFNFDNTAWRPVVRSGTDAQIEVILPPERIGSAGGWGIDGLGPVASVAEVQVYDAATSTPSVTGDQVRVMWDQTTAAARDSAYTRASMNVRVGSKDTLLWIPFQKLNPTSTSSIGYGITILSAFVMDSAPTSHSCSVYVWQHSWVHNLHDNDDAAQPVEWAIKSGQIGIKSSTRIHARGTSVRLLSHGQTGGPLITDLPFGIYNSLLGTDWAGWTSQVVDYTPPNHMVPSIKTLPNVNSIRNRIRTGSPATAQPRTFSGTATWGDFAIPDAGNYLIDEQEVDTITTSDSGKGEYVTYMLFGFIQGRAERLAFESIRAELRSSQGGRRRKGR